MSEAGKLIEYASIKAPNGDTVIQTLEKAMRRLAELVSENRGASITVDGNVGDPTVVWTFSFTLSAEARE